MTPMDQIEQENASGISSAGGVSVFFAYTDAGFAPLTFPDVVFVDSLHRSFRISYIHISSCDRQVSHERKKSNGSNFDVIPKLHHTRITAKTSSAFCAALGFYCPCCATTF